jgi:hypothetical protein
VKVPGKRGRVIKKDPQTAPIVHEIFTMYAAGKKIHEIRKYLIEEDASQIYTSMCKHEWSMPLISRILRSDAYLGKATWTFNDGTIFYVDIPQIIEPELWRIVQKRVERNKVLSTRNAKGVYLLQGLLKCGDCGNSMSATRLRDYTGGFSYRCHTACHNAHEGHPKPYNHNGSYVDWTVWRRIVDQIVSRPDFIKEYIQSQVKELQAEVEHVDGEITRIQRRLEGINDERVFYQRKAAQGKIPEVEFDVRMDETADQIEYWQCELERLLALKNDAALVNDSLSYAKDLFVKIRGQLDYLDCSPEDLEKRSKGERNKILRNRRKIVRALVDRATINSKRKITIEGILDGSEGEQFDLRGY